MLELSTLIFFGCGLHYLLIANFTHDSRDLKLLELSTLIVFDSGLYFF